MEKEDFLKHAQSGENFLAHYGVLGMHWGIRKQYVPHPREGSLKSKYEQFRRESVQRNKARILNSPSSLYRNRKYLTSEEIATAMKKLKIERELRSLSRDTISSGSQMANTIFTYGTAATVAYGLYKSPAAQAVFKQLWKRKKDVLGVAEKFVAF